MKNSAIDQSKVIANRFLSRLDLAAKAQKALAFAEAYLTGQAEVRLLLRDELNPEFEGGAYKLHFPNKGHVGCMYGDCWRSFNFKAPQVIHGVVILFDD